MTTDTSRLTAAIADRYRVERELGHGGMATVYLAHDLKHERDVALKVLHPDLGAALGSDRFLSEIKTTARLQHPHILPLLDSGERDGLLYYVMPYVMGETLRDRLEREKLLPIDDALRIGREVADALDYAHRLGVIHRDIKPENILLQGGHALVADFGIALAVQQAGGQRMTQTGLSLGTPQYMSPEQAMGERTIDARSDIYALGAVIYEMLSGDPPFIGSTVQAIVAKVLTEKPARLVTRRDRVPLHVEDAVLMALEKLPADRWGTAREFADALREPSLTSTATTARREAAAPPAVARRWARPTRLASLALVLVAAGLAAGWGAARLDPMETSGRGRLTVTSLLAPDGGNFSEQRSLALSPDGRRLAFVFAAADGSRMLWLRHLDRLDSEPVPGTSGADAPFWSRDGRSLAYFANGYLAVLDGNGDTRRLCPVSQPTGGSWGASDVILFGDRGGLSIVPANGGACRLILRRGAGSALRGVFMPDGKRFVFSRGLSADMGVASLDGRKLGTLARRAIEFAIAPPGYLIIPNDADARALDVQRINTRSLTLEGPAIRIASGVRSRAGVHTFSVSSGGALAFLPGVADRPYLEYDANGLLRDTVRVEGTWTVATRPKRGGAPLVAVAGNAAGLWLYDLDANRATRLTLRSLTLTPGEGVGATWPVFSADGSRLVYAMITRSDCGVVARDLRTDVERIIVRQPANGGGACPLPIDWSPDGGHFLVRRDTVLELMPLDGTPASVRIARPGQLWEGHFSPDGRAVVYSSDETGRAEVYVQSLPSGPPTRVSVEGGRWPAWTFGGRRLTYMTPDGRVQEVAMASSNSPLGTPRTRFVIPTWRRSTFDDRGTGFAVVGDGERYIVRVSPSSLAVAYMENWPMLLRRTDTGPRP